MGKIARGLVVLVLLGSCFGGDGDVDSNDFDSGYGDTYDGTRHDDVNGNPVPDDCEAWAESDSDPFADGDTYGQELCEAWD
ncbi:hypothetical protein [Nocardioides xinjiangensis]|uniref:hypothetical protein n=1 Tax=Nocardioides xinjiangensis TaxID=2817376 RepID=UPI001B30BC77|nr:hypothetical protein [Nocardioides sp. SYSU D00778]